MTLHSIYVPGSTAVGYVIIASVMSFQSGRPNDFTRPSERHDVDIVRGGICKGIWFDGSKRI